MAEKKIQLTNDTMENIKIMVPFLTEDSRKAVSYLMYGCFLGQKIAEDKAEKERAGAVV